MVQCTLYTVHYTLYTVHFTLYSVHYTLCIVQYRVTHEEVKVIKWKGAKVLWVMSTLSIEMQKYFLL